jgi:2-keto-4-pentenoate hydratase
MTLTSLASRIAHALVQARRSGTPWQPDLPFDDTLDTEQAYAIQRAVADDMGWFAQGKVPAWKAGGKGVMTAAPLPVLLASGTTWQPGATVELIAEAEIALRLGRTPTSAETVIDCVSAMCVSIEMVGTRIVRGLSAPGAWKTADQQVHGVVVAGTEVPFVRQDWSQLVCSLLVNGKEVAATTGGHPNNDPTAPLAFLYAHAQAQGLPLQAGDLITTGACALHKVALGDEVEAVFPGIGRTTVTVAAG